MSEPDRTNRLLLIVAPLGVALVAVLLLLNSLGAPPSSPSAFTPTPNPAQQVVAYVGKQQITFADWTRAFQLDALMNHFSGQPAPTPNETLDRLVNDTLILAAAAEEGITVSRTDVEARVARLLAEWHLTEDEVAAEMMAFGFNREAGVEATARLMTVERYLNEVIWAGVPAEQQAAALESWLQARRARVGVEVDTHGLQPFLPDYLSFPTPAPPDTSPLDTPAATPTALSALTSPLPQPSTSLAVGQPAPDFVLNDANGQPVRLSDYRDQRKVVIVFFRTTG